MKVISTLVIVNLVNLLEFGINHLGDTPLSCPVRVFPNALKWENLL